MAAQQFVDGLHAALLVSAVIAFAAAAVAIVMVRTKPAVEHAHIARQTGRMTSATRLPAAERREALIDTAIRVFSEGSYRGTTTAEIARAAGVSEPILYRHFASKRDLYLAALDHVWGKMRASWEKTLATTPDVRAAIEAMGRGHVTVRDCKFQLAELWVQALGEAAEDPELRKHLRRHMREVHDFLADLIRRGQEEGSSPSGQERRPKGRSR